MSMIKVHLAADTVVDHLANFMRRAPGSRIECSVASYNQVTQALLGDPKGQVLLLWTSPDIQLPGFGRLLSFETISLEEIFAEVDQFASLVKTAAERYANVFVMAWTFPPDRRWPLGLASKPGYGAADILARANIRFADSISDCDNVHIVDLGQLQARYPKTVHDPRLFMMGRMRFEPDFLKFIADQIRPVVEATVQANRKVIICDLDNTLWGGIIGDDGIEGIKLGSPGAIGEAHSALQLELRALNNRGILLAISSKNEQETALVAINQHPNMLLREECFSAHRINWNDKAANILSLLEEINLLPSSAIFLDDNPTERQRVRDAIPDILVPDLPNDVAHWAGIVSSLGCWETLSISKEDLGRASSYRSENERRKSQGIHVSLDDWLQSLEIIVSFRQLNKIDLQRAVQLMNKTNQFNLSTRRFNEADYMEWSSLPQHRAYVCSVSDRYGDSGLTAVLSVESDGDDWQFVDYVMSCRVMGKGIEDAIVAEVRRQLGEDGELRMICTPTTKNGPAQEFAARIAPGGIVPKSLASKPTHVKIVLEPPLTTVTPRMQNA